MKDLDTRGALSKDRLRLWLKLLKVQGEIEASLRRRFRESFGTTLPRFDVMSALARHPDGLRMSDISGLLKVSNGNVTGIVERLVEDGHATRHAVPGDRRAQRVALTHAGIAAFEVQASAHEAWVSDMMRGLDCNDIKILSDKVKVMSEDLEARHAP